MRKMFFLVVCILTINISCQKKNTINNSSKSNIDTLYEPPKSLYFDNDNIKDEVKIQSKQINDFQALYFLYNYHL